MKEIYPELDGYDACPKCNQDFDAKDKDPDMHYGCKSVTENGVYIVLDEWMRRTCKTCSYQWREATFVA